VTVISPGSAQGVGSKRRMTTHKQIHESRKLHVITEIKLPYIVIGKVFHNSLLYHNTHAYPNYIDLYGPTMLYLCLGTPVFRQK